MIDRLSTVLPEPDSPTMPSALPRSSEKRDAVDGAHQPALGAEVRLEIVDVEQHAVLDPTLGLETHVHRSASSALLDVEVGAHLVAGEVERRRP